MSPQRLAREVTEALDDEVPDFRDDPLACVEAELAFDRLSYYVIVNMVSPVQYGHRAFLESQIRRSVERALFGTPFFLRINWAALLH